MDNRPRMQIVRGLPGSGKSTFAASRWPGVLRLELDQYCCRGGLYSWDEETNRCAKRWLSNMVKLVTGKGIDLVVTGVFAGNAENLPKLAKVALYSGYDVYVATLPDRGYGTDVHGVEKEHYDGMMASFVTHEEVLDKLAAVAAKGKCPGTVVDGTMSSDGYETKKEG